MFLQASYQLQRDITNVMFSPFSPRGDVPRLTTKLALDMAQYAAGTAAALLPDGENQVAWLELQNKLEAFNLFAHVDLDLCRGCSLASLIEHASRLGTYRSVWAIEGAGHLYAGLSQIDLKTNAHALPPSSLVPLHSGAGLSFADHCLEAVASDAQLRVALEEFFALCNANSHEGYAGATYEALGLTTRNLHPHLVTDVDRQLAETDETLVAYFWHGVGRAIYFAPTNFLPDASASRRLDQVYTESPHDVARLNVLSGMIWALVLVNVRHPKVLEAFIRANARELNPEVFESALCCAALIWCDSAPDDESLDALCSHRPLDVELAAIWEAHVSRPCLEVLQHYAELREAGLGRLFRHRPLSELIR